MEADSNTTNGNGHRNKAGGAPKGNKNAVKHGLYSLLALRVQGSRPPGNTRLGRAFRAREREYLDDMGGEEKASLAERQLANDNTWCDFIIATMDFQLQNKRQLIRKGKPHPLIELRMRVAAHRRDNYKITGLKRVSRQLTVNDLLHDHDEATGHDDAAANGKADDHD
jgi:hypothetical protein